MPRQRRLPTDDVLLAERAQGKSVARLAADWEVEKVTVYAALRRLGVPAGEARRARATAAMAPSQLKAVAPEPLVAPHPSGRLSVDDLARAAALAQRAQITPDEAVAYVRADVDQAGALVAPFVPKPRPAGFSAYRMPAKVEAWFQALADDRELPELTMEDYDV
ncbi:hypothetical protein [Methylobacterium indicum]|uniref:hypothetical protein n=1 Tax=Methylobacterium indicum TaxID=1775910 RepID=UPI002435635C|nr:hypothetical protein [Methylobacterium indicum]